MNKEKCNIISDIADMLLENNKTAAKSIICQKYPHTYYEIEKRTYTITQKMKQFIRDGFIDRYTGETPECSKLYHIISQMNFHTTPIGR